MFIKNKLNYFSYFNLKFKSFEKFFSTDNNFKFSKKAHPFHMVKPSYLPFFTAWSVFAMAIGAVSIFHKWGFNFIFLFGFVSLLVALSLWFCAIFKEADAGYHTMQTKYGFRIGFVLFVLSEVMFFVSFFELFFIRVYRLLSLLVVYGLL